MLPTQAASCTTVISQAGWIVQTTGHTPKQFHMKTHLQCLNLVQALSILNQLCEGVVTAAARHALHLLANLQGKATVFSVTTPGTVVLNLTDNAAPLAANTENVLCRATAPVTACSP
jgi:hypothetical protein